MSVNSPEHPYRLVVLISGTGTLLQAILDAIAAGTLPAQVEAVVSDRDNIQGLERARAAGVPTKVHPLAKGADRQAWDEELAELVASFQPDLVVSAGFMKIVGPAFLERHEHRMINTHPSLLPSFPGAHAVRDALDHGVKITGCTVFEVDAGVDTGPILAQAALPIEPGDTVESLHERIKVVERQLLLETIHGLITKRGESDDQA